MELQFTEYDDLPISRDIHERLLSAASDAHPNECCGILLGERGRIVAIQPARNVHLTPQTHFELDPQALIDTYRAERAGGPRIAGFYHSHPDSPPVPSETDRASAARDGKIWAIVGQGRVRFWRDAPDGFEALSYSVVDG